MFLLRKPSAEKIREFIAAQRGLPFSYAEVGATQGKLPEGYTIDHNRTKLGYGAKAYDHAVAALKDWQQFNLGWTRIVPPQTPLRADQIVAVRAQTFMVWSLNACRVVYLISEDRKFGFAYGTLREHAERGEERFLVEWEEKDGSVWYDILAFSRPQHLLVRIGRPLARKLQKRFARDSLDKMRKLVSVFEAQT
jgi:uncharacterized protein (UPF0548 family)